MIRNISLKNIFIINIITLILFFYSNSLYSNPAFPNFTDVVEKNIPSVVIVHAKKQMNTPSAGMPDMRNMPDEFKPFLDKFFNENQPNDNQQRQTPSFGSGFILSSDGYIMTNNHVISNSNEIKITLSDQTELDAVLIGTDPRSDLALLKVDANNLPVVSIGTSENLKVGEWVLAIGSPFGFDHTVTAGIVSGKKRNLPNESYVPYIQTDVAINPGNSGGPLFNLNGDVVGVNAQIYTRSGGFMGVSFAIPAETLTNVYNQLKNDGKVKRGWLGVFIQEVDQDLAMSFGLEKPMGAVVAKILDKSPAQKADFKQGDVILAFNGKDVKKSKDLPLLVGSTPVNSTIKVKLLRNKKIIEKYVLIEELPEDDLIANMKEKKVEKTMISGVTVSDIDENTKKTLNIYGGVKIDKISTAQLNNSKIQVNDIVTHINNQPIYNTDDFDKKVKSLQNNSIANLLVYRNTNPIYLAIKILND
ncbi:MAG: Do family serine endopeptidase [Gammaproteobacteria bacterium]|jgi:serine protease Do|nr:Do family serine endopeptidase [Gammaproteobacteria bacterium]MBT4462165.1 Do family serine endopeptidase [Gammaproteobacteria bacterium]MBT4655024.1 Do family serine endopeptidase [Gammaproteobacteria bacterium]MBT5116462.1 Do family serine endopeptidase [Gammaproteobacteria bacterium]MBT5761136.1 Do family serine endopeptidase [Gammaproteobacteria bacterium]